jgi:hypothetical protein
VNYIIVCGQNVDDFSLASNTFYFADKRNITKIITNNSSQYPLHIGHEEKYIVESGNTKLLGLHIDNYLNWKNHFNQLVPKKKYFAYSHSIMKN